MVEGVGGVEVEGGGGGWWRVIFMLPDFSISRGCR